MAAPAAPAERQGVVVLRLLQRGAALLAALALTCALLLAVPAPANDFLQAVQDKLRYLSDARGPRLILLGGSSTAFGFNSREMAAATGRAVINMGVHAGTGLDFMLRSVEDSIRANDVVIVSPEYELFYPSKRANTVLYEILPYVSNPDSYLGSMAESIAYRLHMPVQRLQRTFAYLLKQPFGLVKPEPVYRRDIFNEYGDIALPATTVSVIDTLPFVGFTTRRERLDSPGVKRLHAFAERAAKRGATVLLVYPPYMSLAYRGDSANVQALEAEFRKLLPPAVTIIGHPRDFVQPPGDFFDTQYHLTPTGRERRTAHVIALLEPLLPARR